MKPVLELLAGTSVAVGIVAGGVALASAALEPAEQPHRFDGLDLQDLWTAEPVVVDRNKQNYERLAPRYASHVVMSAPDTGSESAPALPATSALSDIDILMTVSVERGEADTALEGILSPHPADRERHVPISGPFRDTDGQFSIHWRIEGAFLALDWREEIRETQMTAPRLQGFGSKLARTSATYQLGGSIDFDRAATGLNIALEAAAGQLTR